jgi:hypothetical protein
MVRCAGEYGGPPPGISALNATATTTTLGPCCSPPCSRSRARRPAGHHVQGARHPADHRRGRPHRHDLRDAPHLAAARRLLAPRPGRTAHASAGRASAATATRATARRRSAPSRSAARCTGTRRTRACASPTSGCAAATGGSRIPRRRRTTRSATSLRDAPAVQDADAGHVEVAARLPVPGVVNFNMSPVVPGRGSGIFLHAQTGSSTNGCVSIPRADLARVLAGSNRPRSPTSRSEPRRACAVGGCAALNIL